MHIHSLLLNFDINFKFYRLEKYYGKGRFLLFYRQVYICVTVYTVYQLLGILAITILIHKYGEINAHWNHGHKGPRITYVRTSYVPNATRFSEQTNWKYFWFYTHCNVPEMVQNAAVDHFLYIITALPFYSSEWFQLGTSNWSSFKNVF
jgi:hypothetical protein